MNMKTRIAKFLITLASFTMMTSASAYQGSDCCNPCSFDPCCPSPNRCFYAEADYIYWGVQQDGLRFAVSGFGEECCNEQSTCNGNSCNTSCNNNCDCKDQNLDWNSGFKIGAGMANPCCDWELFVQYTYYQANPKRCVESKNENCELIGTWFPPSDFAQVSLARANSNWKLCFNNIDALITNEFCVNNCFSFRPSFGLKGAWTHQKHKICYTPGEDELGAPVYKVFNKQDFWGVGPKFAMTATASVFDCFSLYGNLGLSTLYGSYDVKRNDKLLETTDTPPEESVGVVCLCSCRYHVQPVLETSFGLRWDTELCCGDYGFYVNLAWEHQIWFNHNDFIELTNNANRNMTLHGVTVGAGISF